jgi:hypothetical protein
MWDRRALINLNNINKNLAGTYIFPKKVKECGAVGRITIKNHIMEIKVTIPLVLNTLILITLIKLSAFRILM